MKLFWGFFFFCIGYVDNEGEKIQLCQQISFETDEDFDWHEAQAYIGDTPALSQFSPIWGNYNFVAGRADGAFKQWADKGLGKIIDMYSEGKNMPRSQESQCIIIY